MSGFRFKNIAELKPCPADTNKFDPPSKYRHVSSIFDIYVDSPANTADLNEEQQGKMEVNFEMT